jgi:cytochrome c oxidase subunit 4
MKTPAARTPFRYVAVLGGLLALLGLTIGLSYVDLGPLNLFAALAIAGLKALLVLLYFMDLIRRVQAPRLAFGMGLFLVALFIALALTDYVGRTHLGDHALPVRISQPAL